MKKMQKIKVHGRACQHCDGSPLGKRTMILVRFPIGGLYYTGWPRKHYPSLSQVAEILLIMTQIGHFATRFLTKSKEMGTIWTSRFEDKSLNFIARYF